MLPAALVSPETSKLLDMLGEGTIDDKLRKLLDTKHELKEQNSKLKLDLEEKESKIGALEKKLAQNMSKMQDTQEQANDLHELQRQYTKEINDFKMKNQKLEHENIVIKQDLQRLQTQLKYMQTNFDELEASEQRLNKEKREAQRELKESKNLIKELQDRVERLELSQKTFEKKRQIQKFNDISSSASSFSNNTSTSTPGTVAYSLTPGQTSTSNKDQLSTGEERTATPDSTTNPSSTSDSTHQVDQMINSTSTVTTESSSPVLSSRSSTSSSASNSPSSSQETKEQTLNDENSIQDELLSSSSTSSLANNNDVNKTPISTKAKRLSSNEIESQWELINHI